MQLLEPRPQEALGGIGIGVAAARDQAADRLRQSQGIGQRRHGTRLGLGGHDPAAAGAQPAFGSGHAGKLGGRGAPNNHHSAAAYSRTPHPSQTSGSPVPTMMLRRCIGIIVSQLPHDWPRRANSATDRWRRWMRS